MSVDHYVNGIFISLSLSLQFDTHTLIRVCPSRGAEAGDLLAFSLSSSYMYHPPTLELYSHTYSRSHLLVILYIYTIVPIHRVL